MGNIMRVISVDNSQTDKNNHPYHIIELGPEESKFVKTNDGRTVKVKNLDKGITITAWDKREINGQTFAKMPEFDLKKEDQVEGNRVTRVVEQYEIDGNIVGTYSCFVIGDDQDKASWEAAVKATFNARQHPIVEANMPAPAFAPLRAELSGATEVAATEAKATAASM